MLFAKRYTSAVQVRLVPLMAAAQQAREALAVLDEQEANFMMQHIGEIAGVLNGASQSMGIDKDMLSRGLGQEGDTLKGLETRST
ncbi:MULTISPECIES: hypothetical protein [unclassified Pseudomonas]|uniref:hypothetical protein n=1 Tax=unclassified Pseudomonas TaxID=196821 RepID=UPI002097DD6C|nr:MULTISPECIES: hypothetical protein [unclassified Pseudomonas]MCO7521288.1 hypothetical protein [Pseudomonas sp. 1]MCO7539855.1 hypothetical protein [Pseudomonas sp. VA159-2]